MKTRAIGSSGLVVGRIGLGGMPLSLAGRPKEDDAVEVICAAIDAGMTLIDTADVYCIDDDDLGHNERLIARALDERPGAEVVVATKGGLERPGGDWVTNGRPEHLKRACERSLRALRVDCIELYQLHAPDDDVPLSDSVGALADLQRDGKIRHIGLSNVSVPEIEEARGIVDVVSVQNRLNLFDTQSYENGVVGYCQEQGIAFFPHSPVGGHRGHARLADHEGLAALAARTGHSVYELCLAYLLTTSPAMIPIPGASKVKSAVSSARAADLELDTDVLTEIAALFPAARV